MIVRLVSTAQTGFFYTTQRLRIGPTLAAVKYDPVGECVRLMCGDVSDAFTKSSNECFL